ncbi:MAG: DUF374 domain-containing protein [Thermoanaerobaculia bacterium]
MKLLPTLAATFIRVLHATLRVKHVRVEHTAQPQSIVAFWHMHILMMLHSRYPRPITVMSSASKDGDLAVGVYQRFGVSAVRGSSTRGGSGALRDLIGRARRGESIVFTPDGPRGPAREVKMGLVFAAQSTGLPIVPVAFDAKKKSFCARGIGCSCRCRSRRRSSSTAIRSAFRGMATLRSGA